MRQNITILNICMAIVIGNFIHLPFTLAKRHQEAVAYRLKSAKGNLSSFIHKGVEIGPGKVLKHKVSNVCLWLENNDHIV
jgi:hypothetical protein